MTAFLVRLATRAAAPIAVSCLMALSSCAPAVGRDPPATQVKSPNSADAPVERSAPSRHGRNLPADPEARAAYLRALRAKLSGGQTTGIVVPAPGGAVAPGASSKAGATPGVYAPLQAPAAPATPAAAAPATASATAAPSVEPAPAGRAAEASYTGLAHPAVAERLKLTDEQRKKLAELMAERAEALAKAQAADRDKVLKGYEEKLSGVLTDEQRTLWAKRPAEPKLRFNFRFQRWADVLEWFARQADLSLVLDAPPPGTFNYSDTREYTPSEAIDLLNGVLMTKGYTLIRHDRMLLVVNLADGLPEGLVPRITIEELDQRGRFEMVTVMFPLGGRSPNDVTTEIKPLLGPNGKATVMPITGQLMVTDTAGVMRAISAVIQSMPLAGQVPGGPPEMPQLVVYPIRSIDPDAAAQVLRTLMPNATFVADTRTNHLSAYAGPTQQGVVKAVLDQMEADNTPDKQPRLEVYPVGPTANRQLMLTLQSLVPRARISLEGDKLIAVATPADQKLLGEAVTKFGGGTAPENTRQIQTYRLTTADSTSTLTLLRTIVPNATVTYDGQTHDLVALAIPADQQTIKATLSQLQRDMAPAERLEMVAYPINSADPASVQRIMKNMFPNLQIVIDFKAKRLLAWATLADQKTIKEALDKIDAVLPGGAEQSFNVYPVGTADPQMVQLLLQEQFPDVQFVPDMRAGTILVRGRKADQDKIGLAVKQIQTGADQGRVLAVYTLQAPSAAGASAGKAGGKAAAQSMAASGVISVLRMMFPEAQFALGPDPNKLIAWAKPPDHEGIKKAVEELSKPESAETARRVTVYTLETASAANALAILRTMFADAQFSVGTDANKIVSYARPADQEAIHAAVEEMSKPEPAATAYSLVVYTLESAGGAAGSAAGGGKAGRAATAARPAAAANAIPVLRSMFPNAQFAVGAEPSRLVVWARPADHAAIKKAVEELSAREPAETAPRVEVYTTEAASAAAALPVLRSMFPDAQFSVGADPSQVVAFARPAYHEVIKTVVEQLSKKEPPETARQVVVYTVQAMSTGAGGRGGRGYGAAVLLPVLRPMFPDAQFTLNPDPMKLTVWARPADHAAIKKAVEEMSKKEPAETTPKVVVYSMPSATATAAMAALRGMFPDAQFSAGADPSQVVAFARPEDHAAIKLTIDELSKQEPPGQARQVVVYTVPARTTISSTTSSSSARIPGAAALMTLLRPMFPDAQFTVGSNRARLIVWARPADHVGIKKALDEMTKKDPPELAPRVVVYTLESTPAASAVPILTAMFAEGQFSVGADPNKVVALARPADHELIKQAIEQMSQKEPPEQARQVAVYTVPSTGSGAKFTGAAALITVLTPMFPNVQFSVGADPMRLVAWARPADQAAIKKAVEEMTQKEPAETAPKVVVYTTDAATAAAALTGLRAMFPGAQFSAGADPSQVVAFARPEDQTAIKVAIDEMAKKEPPEHARQVVVYTVPARATAGSSGSGPRIPGAPALMTLLKPMFPDAQFTVGSNRAKLIVWARPTDHTAIKKALDEMTKKDPPELAHRVEVYALESTPAAAAVPILTAMFPEAQFSVGADPNKVVALARPADHELIKQAAEQMSKKEPPEHARQVAVYTVPMTTVGSTSSSSGTKLSGAEALIPALKTMFPDGQFTVGADPTRLVAWARPADQEAIKKAVEEMAKKDSPETAAKVVVYTVDTATATAALAALKVMFPDSQFAAGADPGQVVANARPADQALIKQAVEEMAKKEPPAQARQVVVHTVPTMPVGSGSRRSGAAGWIMLLKPMFPDAQFSVGVDPTRMIAWARPADQEAIKKAVEEMAKKEPAATAPKAAVYSLSSISTTAAIPILQSVYTDAQFAAGSDPSKLIVWARPADHERIKASIDELETAGLPGGDRVLAIYPMKRDDAAALAQMLDPVLKQDVLMVPDAARNRLLVWADAKHQQTLKQMIDQYTKELGKAQEPLSKVYQFRIADPRAAQTVLASLVPAAQMALDLSTRSLVVSAMPEDHAKIKATIEEMDREDSGGAPRLQIHRVVASDAPRLLTLLTALFRQRPDVRLSVDEQNNALVVVAPQSQQEIIKTLVEQADKGLMADPGMQLELYPLRNVDSAAVMQVLTTVFQKQGTKVQISVEPRSNQLVAIARPEQQTVIRSTVEKMRGEERDLEIFQLEVADASTVQMAIDQLFAENGMIRGPAAPVVDADVTGQQLFIRATKEQFTQIRDLLVKMGETSLSERPGGDGRRSRTIPFEGDPAAALLEVQRAWSQLRPNPLQINTAPPAALPPATPPPAAKPAAPEPKPANKNEPAKGGTAQPAAAAKKSAAAGPCAPWLGPGIVPKWAGAGTCVREGVPLLRRSSVFSCAPALLVPSSGTHFNTGPLSLRMPVSLILAQVAPSPRPSPARGEGGHQPPDPQGKTEPPVAAKPAPPPAAPAPITITFGEGKITISSDDVQALDQFETLLRTLTQHGGTVGRNMSVFVLHNARAATVAEDLQRLYTTTPTGRRGGAGASRIMAIPDERLNAVVVYSNRADRTTIENLVKMLDSAQVPELLAANRMKLIPVKNTSAAGLEPILRGMFKTSVDSLSVEDATNSLVVVANPAVQTELERAVKTLDDAAGEDPARQVRIIPLQKANALHVQQSLNAILQGGKRPVRSSSSSSR